VTSTVKNKRDLSAEDVKLLRELGALLDAHAGGKSLEPDQAAAFRDELRRIAGPKYSAAQELEMSVAACYIIRKELAGPGKSKLARAAAAKACGVTDQTVSTYCTRWRDAVVTMLDMQMSTPRYAGLTRPQMLEQLLAVYEKFGLPDPVKRKRHQIV
jgi:hypothetical protein